MPDGLRSRIDAICKTQAALRQTALDESYDLQAIRSTLNKQFCAVRSDVVEVVMQAFRCYFTDQFYNARIVNDDAHIDQFGRKMFKLNITLRVYKDAHPGDALNLVPHYSVLWDDVNCVVRYYKSTTTKTMAGEAGFDGKSNLQEITADLIERKLLGFTDWLFGDRGSLSHAT